MLLSFPNSNNAYIFRQCWKTRCADDHPFIETVDDTIFERPQEPPAEESVADETVAEPTITMPTERTEHRYPPSTTRTSYKDDRVYNMNLKTALNRHGKKVLRSIYLEFMQMPEKQVFTRRVS